MTARPVPRQWLRSISVLLVLFLYPAFHLNASEIPDDALTPVELKVYVDGEYRDHRIRVYTSDRDVFLVRDRDLRALDIPMPQHEGIHYRGIRLHPVELLAPLAARVNTVRGTINFITGAAFFPLPSSRLRPPEATAEFRRSPPEETDPGKTERAEEASSLGLRPPRSWLSSDNVKEIWMRTAIRAELQDLTSLVLIDERSRWYVRSKDMIELNLPVPDSRPVRYLWEDYFPLDELSFSVRILPYWRVLMIDPPPAGGRLSDAASDPGWFGIVLNDQSTYQTGLAFIGENGRLLIDGDTLEALRIDVQSLPATRHAGIPYIRLNETGTVSYVTDREKQQIHLFADADAFKSSRIDQGEHTLSSPDTSESGLFLNYSLFGEKREDRQRSNGLFELGAFGGEVFFSSTHVARDAAETTGPRATEAEDRLRLETRARVDWPSDMRTLTVGDTVSNAGTWSRPVRYGGIQWGTNFETRPGFVPLPLEELSGETTVPSTVDIYINNTLRASREVPAGPFIIDNVPVITGSGDIRLVVRDIFGREHTIVEPFYATRSLLRDGLHDYTYEIGAVRNNFGILSEDYGEPFVSITHRLGLTDSWTGEIHTEATQNKYNLGLANTFLLGNLGEMTLIGATSRAADAESDGRLWEAGYRYRGDIFQFGGSVRETTDNFWQLDLREGELPHARETRGFFGFQMGILGSVNLGYTEQIRRNAAPRELATATYSLSLGSLGNLTVNAFDNLQIDGQRGVSAFWTLPFGGRHSATLSHESIAGRQSNRIDIRRNLSSGPGVGYRIGHQTGATERSNVGLDLRSSAGTLSLDGETRGDSTAYRGNLTGAVAAVGWRPYLTRRLDSAFAVVETPGLTDVTVYHENREVGETGMFGTMIVPNMRDFEENRLRIEQGAIPLDVRVDTLSKEIVPGYRRGVHTRFEIERTSGVQFTAVTADGKPLPRGTELKHEETDVTYPVGWEGRSYIEGSPGEHTLTAQLRDGSCRLTVTIPPNEMLAFLGERVCRRDEWSD